MMIGFNCDVVTGVVVVVGAVVVGAVVIGHLEFSSELIGDSMWKLETEERK